MKFHFGLVCELIGATSTRSSTALAEMSAALVKLADDLARCAETQKSGYLEASIWTKAESIARQLANGLRSHGQTGSSA
jgi:hypothetical protein